MKKTPIRIGFPYENYPRIFRDDNGKWSGIHVDLWKIFAESIGTTVEFSYPDFKHFGHDDPDGVDGRFVAGVMGLLQNDSIDAAIGDYNLQQGRMGSFQYTPPYDYQPMNLIRKERAIVPNFFMRIGEFVGSFGQYTYVIAVNLIIVAFFTFFLKYFTNEVKANAQTYGIKFCIVFNVFMAITLYNACFAGGNLIAAPQMQKETLSKTIHQLTHDNATLIVRDISHLLGAANKFFFGTDTPEASRITILTTKTEIINRLCADPNAIYFDYLTDFVEFYNVDDIEGQCTLTIVANDLTKGDAYTVGTSLGKPSSIVNYYVADRIKNKKKLEFIILGMFDADKFDNYWFPRYMGRPAIIPPEPPAKFTYFSFSLKYLFIFFSVLWFGFAISFVVLILEIVWFRRLARISAMNLNRIRSRYSA